MFEKSIIRIASASVIFGITAGCQTREKPPGPQEFTHVPVFVAASAIPGDSQEKIMFDSRLKAYAVGRYLDPASRTVMHEQHTVYRVEQTPQWNLMPQPDADPVMLAQRQRQERYANALTGQLTLAVRDMQIARNSVNRLVEQQANDQERAANLQTKLEDMTRKYGSVSDNIAKSAEVIRKLENDVRKIQKENEIMKLQLKRNRESKNDEK